MLDLILKFFKRKPDSKEPLNKEAQQKESNKKQIDVGEKQKNEAKNRLELMEKIQTLSHNESALVDLVLECDFADGRYQVAQFIYSKNALEKIKNAMLKTDKRVVKLMQVRLDIILQAEKDEQLARQYIHQAEHLLKQDCLLLNQIIDLDKQVSSISQFPSTLHSIYSQLREQLDHQITAQQNLQRRLLNISKKIKLETQNFSEEKWPFWEEQLQECKAELDAILADEKANSIPKNLMNDVTTLLQSRQIQLTELKKTSLQLSTDSLLSVLMEPKSETQNVTNRQHHSEQLSSTQKNIDVTQFEAQLKQLEVALENGSMQSARQIERELKAIQLDNSLLSPMQRERLQQARSQFLQMQSLVKWSSDVSRNELISTAAGLSTINLNPQDIVATVKALRQQWKQLEATSGGASKALWEKFDQLCNQAYAPAAQYFQEKNEQRKINLVKAQNALIGMSDQVKNLLLVDESAINWKQVPQLIRQFQQDWKALNDFDRQHQGKMSQQFEELLNTLRNPLLQRQKEEILQRTQLIEQAKKIDANERNALDQIRSLQERWQLQAKSIPLRHQDEQILWDQFRAACDAVFQKRKQFSEAADAQRQNNLHLKIQICEKLEKSKVMEINESIQLIQKSTIDWKELGAIPREKEAEIEKRFQAALNEIHRQIDLMRNKEQQQNTELLCKKILLCQTMETLLINSDIEDSQKQEQKTKLVDEWMQLTTKDNKNVLHSALENRFGLANQAFLHLEMRGEDLVQKNSSLFDEIILHLEILMGIDSPEGLTRERLQKQVQVLQSSLKNGADGNREKQLLSELVALPVILDVMRQQRMNFVLNHIS